MIFVVDDDQAVRDSLSDLFVAVGLKMRGFGSTREFLQSERPETPSCLVLDVKMPGENGLNFQDQLAKLNIHLPIIFITGHGDIPMSVRAMKAGAVEFLTKPFDDKDLLAAVHTGLEKDAERRRKAAEVAELRERFSSLTAGEQRVMALVVQGRLNKQIAAELGVSEITVKVRRGHLMQKMQLRSLAELIGVATRLGMPTAGSTDRDR